MPEETLSASSEIVPVGAIEVQQRVADAVAADRGAHLLGQRLDRLAGEISRAVVEREAALLRRDVGRGEIGQALHRAQPLARELDRARRTVAHAAQDQRVGEARDAKADAALVLGLALLLRQRKARDVDHIVEHAHRQRHQPLQFVHVERRLRREGLLHQDGKVDRAQQTRAIRGSGCSPQLCT